jgi:hypothetical protein
LGAERRSIGLVRLKRNAHPACSGCLEQWLQPAQRCRLTVGNDEVSVRRHLLDHLLEVSISWALHELDQIFDHHDTLRGFTIDFTEELVHLGGELSC